MRREDMISVVHKAVLTTMGTEVSRVWAKLRLRSEIEWTVGEHSK